MSLQTLSMPLQNVAEVLLAGALFVPLLLAPGFVFGWVTDIAGFRRRTPGTRLLLANVFSVSLCPVCTYLIARCTAFAMVWLFYGVLWLAFAGLFFTRRGVRESLLCIFTRSRRAYLIIVIAWILVGTVSLIDIRTPARLYHSLCAYDYIKHTSVVDAITRTGVPPVNPCFHPGRDQPLCYYYLWHLLCSLVDRLGGGYVSARSAAQGGALWAGLSLFSITILYLRLTHPTGQSADRRREFVALGLLLATGLDVLPAVTYRLLRRLPLDPPLPGVMEWWNEQVTAWANVLIWVPQHLSSLVASLTSFLVLRLALDSGSRRAAPILLGAVGLSSALGMSIWVGGVAFGILAVWVLLCLRERRVGEALAQGALASVSILVCLPFLLDLRAANASQRLPVAFGIRHFGPLDLILQWYHCESPCLSAAAHLVLLPLNYMMELGFFLVAALCFWRWRVRQTSVLGITEKYLLTACLTSILVCTFFRSAVQYNDLGWRGFLPAQFAMLLWSVPVVESLLRPRLALRRSPPPALFIPGKARRAILLVMLLMGTTGTVYDLMVQRATGVGLRVDLNLELAQAYEWVGDHTAPGQIIQHRPQEDLEYFSGLYAHRQMVITDEPHGMLFGVDAGLFYHVEEELQRIFQSGSPANDALSIGKRYNITALIFRSSDPIWEDRESWIWKARPAFQNECVKVYLTDELHDEP
jgi:hypothetical protein